MSIKALSDYTFYSRYSHYNKEKERRETWNEAVERLFEMHRRKYAKQIEKNPELNELIDFAENQQKRKRVLASQRSLQFSIEPILKHELKMFNCFTRDTEFVTTDGVKSFGDFEDFDEINVFGHSGEVRKAVVRNYGRDSFNRIKIKRGKSKEYIYHATKNHRWLLKDESITDNLQVGDYVMSSKDRFSDFDFNSAEWDEKLYWCYGMVFGDGTVNTVDGVEAGSLIRLCGHDKNYISRFAEMGFKSSSPHSIGGDTFFYTGKYFKTAPNPEIDDPRLIRAFVRGYLDADGNKDNNCTKNNKFTAIVATGEKHYEFIRKCFPIAGVYIVSEKNITGDETNYGTRGDARLFQLRNSFDRSNKYEQPFRVVSIDEDVVSGDAWCLEVEEDSSFTLPNGMITGNCLFTHIDRERVFQEMMYSLLCGCGVGFSVQYQHIEQLGKLISLSEKETNPQEVTYTIEDSIEGWADAVGVLLSSWFKNTWGEFDEYKGKKINFDFSKIRPEGSLIAGRYKAPGYGGLKSALQKMEELLQKNAKERGFDKDWKLKPINAYDLIMFISDAVLSGGVRRSATLCLFSKEDTEMLKAKTGNWFVDNPHRARSNNSVALLRGHVTKKEFSEIMKSTRECGEPGFVWTEDLESGFNPCVEINLYPKTKDGRSGFHACNLTEINGKFCNSEEEFMKACKASAIIGTLQAGYTNLKYLKPESKEIFEEEALLGCSITGWMDNPDILFDPQLQKKGAKEILDVNEKVANLIGIKTSARATCVKPAGCGIPETRLRTTEGDKTYGDIFAKNGIELSDYKNSGDIWFDTKDDNPTYIINENNEPELVTKLYINGYDEVYDIYIKDGLIITLTGKHKVKLSSGEWRRIDELIGFNDFIFKSFENDLKIIKNIIKRNEKQFTVDIETEHTHTYQFANGCVSHNSTSCVLGTSSGIHPHHAVRYIRRTQVNRSEFCGQVFQKYNPLAVESSVWSANGTDNVISFLCEVPVGAITKNQVGALDLLEKVKLTQKNWVEYGTREERCINPKLRHNVSNTINVKDSEWDDVEKYIFNNQKYFAGISLLPESGDLDYPQAPFSTILTPSELVKEYGDASVFASGLVVDGLHAFNDNLWDACNAVLGMVELENCGDEPEYPKSRNYKELSEYFKKKEEYEKCVLKNDWVRRVKQFADRYFEGNIKKATYCLKHVSLWKSWCDLKREYKEINWNEIREISPEYQEASKQSAAACAGGKCSIEF